MKKHYKIVLAGNPNCGKTTIFNALTGTRQHVGNYSGVTVERKSGMLPLADMTVEVIDLPGIYSMSSSSPEEKVAFEELAAGDIDLILNVIDAGNCQRNLYLTTQLAELNYPMILVFNMIDEAYERGMEFDFGKFERFFGTLTITTVGSKSEGIADLKAMIAEALLDPDKREPVKPGYGQLPDAMIAELTVAVDGHLPVKYQHLPPRYFAIKLLDDDAMFVRAPEFVHLAPRLEEMRKIIATRSGVNSQTLMADRRYGVIAGACREAISISNQKQRQVSDWIDKVVLNRFLGMPIFLLTMYLVFVFTFSFSEPLMELLEGFFNVLTNAVNGLWPQGHWEYVRMLITDGIIGGVGGVLVFLPNILLLFLAIAFLEGTGYMARAAFVMDGVMHKFGLHGKSFIPMLLGFGCSVPAIMATRTIESERDRLATIMVLPLMSCGARLPIYSLFIPAFFPEKFQALMMWLIYVIGVLLAVLIARLLKSTLFKGDEEVFVMELPPYRMPTFGSLLLHMWERAIMYLKKAGTVILLASVIMFVINTFPQKMQISNPQEAKLEQLEYSLGGRIGKKLEVVLAPLGFDWRVSSALVGAFAGKELFVSQLSIIYSTADDDQASLRQLLQQNYSKLQAFCIMLFCLISMPCIATVAVVRRETNSWKLAMLQIAGLTMLAYGITLVVYQVGKLLFL